MAGQKQIIYLHILLSVTKCLKKRRPLSKYTHTRHHHRLPTKTSKQIVLPIELPVIV